MAAWHTLSREQIYEQLGTSPTGLASDEVARRLAQHGPNELTEAPRPGFWSRLWGQLNSFIVIILIVAAVISAILGDHVESGAILAIVVLNAVLGLVQEGRAEAALEALRKLAAPEAKVLRDGHRQMIPAAQLVPGDVVVLEAGNYVPADVRLVEAVNLRVEESALTGESEPVEKDASIVLSEGASLGDRLNCAFMGTMVSYGRGEAIVVDTGMRTQIGRIATMLQGIEQEPTPLQRRLDQLGRFLGTGALVICGLVFVVGLLRGYDPLEMFLVAVSLAVAAVPEGLPAVVTITLALGMREMIRRHALIRRLASVETLGSTTVICADKTGTLTQDVMTVTRLWAGGRMLEVTDQRPICDAAFMLEGRAVDLQDHPATMTTLWVATLANDAVMEADENEAAGYQVVGDPTEAALLVAAAKHDMARDRLEQGYPRISEAPFDSVRKLMTTVHKVMTPQPGNGNPFHDADHQGWEVAATKGAPEIVLERCTWYQDMDGHQLLLADTMREKILSANDLMSEQALRVLALAYRAQPNGLAGQGAAELEHDLTFVGLMGMIDPPRPEVPQALQRARQAGIRTIMITGDYARTARAIAQGIGLIAPDGLVQSGANLQAMTDADLERDVLTTNVYARVSPEHKMRIVGALQRNGQIAAMTGDGVNDAPALKRANIGVAMGITGTDVAKEAAAVVLTDDNYASIVAAVEQGRIIYANIRKFVYYLLSCNLAEIMVILLAILAGLPSPLTAIQSALAEPTHRWSTCPGAGAGKERARHHAAATAPADRAYYQQIHAHGHRGSDDGHHHRRAGRLSHRLAQVRPHSPDGPYDGFCRRYPAPSSCALSLRALSIARCWSLGCGAIRSCSTLSRCPLPCCWPRCTSHRCNRYSTLWRSVGHSGNSSCP